MSAHKSIFYFISTLILLLILCLFTLSKTTLAECVVTVDPNTCPIGNSCLSDQRECPGVEEGTNNTCIACIAKPCDPNDPACVSQTCSPDDDPSDNDCPLSTYDVTGVICENISSSTTCSGKLSDDDGRICKYCVTPVCDIDGKISPGETGVDCGGPLCPACPTTSPCGNGVCDSGETSSSCPTDCPAPPPGCTPDCSNAPNVCSGQTFTSSNNCGLCTGTNAGTKTCPLGQTCDTSTNQCVAATYSITGSNCTILSGQTLCSSTISWSTPTGTNVEVRPRRSTTSQCSGTLFSSTSPSGSSTAPFIDSTGFNFDLCEQSGTYRNTVFVRGTTSSSPSPSPSAPSPPPPGAYALYGWILDDTKSEFNATGFFSNTVNLGQTASYHYQSAASTSGPSSSWMITELYRARSTDGPWIQTGSQTCLPSGSNLWVCGTTSPWTPAWSPTNDDSGTWYLGIKAQGAGVSPGGSDQCAAYLSLDNKHRCYPFVSNPDSDRGQTTVTLPQPLDFTITSASSSSLSCSAPNSPYIDLTWTTSNYVQNYTIYRTNASEGTYIVATNLPASTTTYRDPTGGNNGSPGPVNSTSYTYQIQACNSTGCALSPLDSVTAANCVPPTVDLKVNGSQGPITISPNFSASLSWTSTNTSSCTASALPASATWSGSKATAGSESTGTLTSLGTYKYTLTCSNPSLGSVLDNVFVEVSNKSRIETQGDVHTNTNINTSGP